MKENSKILISAASGKVGQHVVTQLAQKKVPFRAGVHSQTSASALRESGIETAVLDFENSNGLAAGFKGVDTVFLVTPGSPDQGRPVERRSRAYLAPEAGHARAVHKGLLRRISSLTQVLADMHVAEQPSKEKR